MGILFKRTVTEQIARVVGRQAWLPVRVRHWPYNLLDSFRQRAVSRLPLPTNGEFEFVAFTCRKHFPLLENALRTLLLVAPPRVRTIWVFVDENDYFDTNELDSIQRLSPLISIRKWPTFTGWGFDSVRLQFRTFAELATRLKDGDYLVKIDSDLLFISSWIFSMAMKSGADVVGDGRYVDFDYAQGGFFFLSKAVAARLEHYCQPGAMEALLPGRKRPAEEEVLREVLRLENSRVWLTRFMMFPDEFKPVMAGDTRFVGRRRRRFCVLHFVRDKDAMPRICRTSVLPMLEPPRETGTGATPSEIERSA